MCAVASIDDRGVAHRRRVLWRSGHVMPDDDAVGSHRLKIPGRIEQGFALGNAGIRDTDVNCVGRETLGGDFKRGASASRRLEEQIDDSATTKSWDLFYF